MGIYTSRHFKREMSAFYVQNKFSLSKLAITGSFLALLSFALHFVFQTMYESVLTDVFPEIMLPSYFSSIYMYTIVSFVFMVVYFINNYTNYTFAEIRQNNWYVLSKSGFDVNELIRAKFEARYFSVLVIYASGYAINLLATSLLGYPFVTGYLLPLFLMGLIDVLLIVSVTMTVSLYIDGKRESIVTIIASALIIVAIKYLSNYYDVVSNRALMQNLVNMFDPSASIYIPIAIVTFLACILFCAGMSRRVASFYTLNPLEHQEDYYTIDGTDAKGNGKGYSKATLVLTRVVSIVLVTVVVISIAFNAFVLIMSTSTDEDGAIMGYIPRVFQSDTMEPAIAKNDLVLFRKVDVQKPLAIGDIVIYKYNNVPEIGRIISIIGTDIVTNIDHYPINTPNTMMRRDITRADVVGEFYYKNRLLGALILFSNSLFGRIIMLLVPTVILFYYKQINEAIKKRAKKKRGEAEE